ncbi:hypothetical protein B0H17DRAFT_1220211 [Mycena rosella]|uniref:Transmembrane protein n=1 Tax=Mycena rosella TaxID=1033263 RepID=A0AAD7BBY3_MYCRO|nr:hypothetical protein B0H17DRAFT_1220211 [Mycena rosella]
MGGTQIVPNQFVVAYGVQLASSWVNMVLYALELVVCLRYFQRSSRPLPHKIGVGAMVLCDTLCTMAINADVFVTFELFVRKASLQTATIPPSVTIFMTYCTASIVQLFLIHLYFVLIRNQLVTAFLGFLVAVHLGFSFAAGIMIFTEWFTAQHLIFTVAAVGAILCGLTDILIAGCLGTKFFNFKLEYRHGSTPSLIRRIFILSLTSGAIVASTTILMITLFVENNIGKSFSSLLSSLEYDNASGPAFDFFFSCQGRVYALTLLVNFLSDSSAKSMKSGKRESDIEFRADASPTRISISGVLKFPPPPLYSPMSVDSLKELPPIPAMARAQGSASFAPALFTAFHSRSTSGPPTGLTFQTVGVTRMISSPVDRSPSLTRANFGVLNR